MGDQERHRSALKFMANTTNYRSQGLATSLNLELGNILSERKQALDQ
jgi:hypothetical protein